MYVEHCSSPDRRKAVRVGSDAWALRSVQRIGRWCAQNRLKHYLRVLLSCCIRLEWPRKCIRLEWPIYVFFSGWGGYRRTPPASSCPLEYASIHLISSSPSSTIVDLDRHRAGWPWVESLSRSSIYRRTDNNPAVETTCQSVECVTTHNMFFIDIGQQSVVSSRTACWGSKKFRDLGPQSSLGGSSSCERLLHTPADLY